MFWDALRGVGSARDAGSNGWIDSGLSFRGTTYWEMGTMRLFVFGAIVSMPMFSTSHADYDEY